MHLSSQFKEDLLKWLEDNHIQHKFISERILEVPEFGKFYLIEGTDNAIISGQKVGKEEAAIASLVFSQDEWIELGKLPDSVDFDYFLFQFGSLFFYTVEDENIEMNLFKYVGKAPESFTENPLPFLGIHGGYELCKGARPYEEWIAKAKYMGVETLGICEEHTLGGSIVFQKACEKAKVNSIVGETFVVKDKKDAVSKIKLYPFNRDGWSNLLRLNTIVNVRNEGKFIEIDDLKKHTEGLICILSTNFSFEKHKQLIKYFEKSNIYYQLDICEWSHPEVDREWLECICNYVKKYHKEIKPILLQDAYYLDEQDAKVKVILKSLGKHGFENHSKDQWFKPTERVWEQFQELANDDQIDNWWALFEESVDSLLTVTERLIEFSVPVGEKHLPHYKMTEEEAAIHETNEDLFWAMIADGMQKKVVDEGLDYDLYQQRLEKEIEVIIKGEVMDYFLILSDLIRWARSNDIIVGNGRGSAAGCLVSYLLDIVKIDPIKYGLLFERFLNEGRVGKSLPDIDTDIMTSRRDEVKRYMEDRYGVDYVTSIGTYSTFKIKAAFVDLARYFGVNVKDTRYNSGAINDTEGNYGDFIKQVAGSTRLQKYAQENPALIETFPLILGQPKNTGMHAAGVVLVPEERGTIGEQMPIRKVDGVLVSEWEGSYIEDAGFLKCDLLGLKQLDKFDQIMKLVKKHHDVTIDLFDIPLDDPKVYELFKQGNNQDVFQFGGGGLKNYCRQLKPDNIEDLIATVALYRPGPIGVGFHDDYVKMKNGERTPTYYTNCEDILQLTYGVIVYQEQVMQIVQKVGGFTLVEADDIRKAMGKKLPELMESYKNQFIEGAMNNGVLKDEAEHIWDDIEGFAGYAFNRSHATCYAILGYYSQWFKANYPLEFWTVSLQHAKDALPARVSEMHKISDIQLAPPDINKSESIFVGDPKTNKIYWSINSIKQAGEATILPIFEERAKNGDFFSLEEFCTRVKVRSNAFVNMVICGVFDEIEGIKALGGRYKILEEYVKFIGSKKAVDIQEYRSWSELQWLMKQKELCGYGTLDFKKFIRESGLKKYEKNYKANGEIVSMEVNKGDAIPVVVAGIVVEGVESTTKKGEPYFKVLLDDGTGVVDVKIWSNAYDKEQMRRCKNTILIGSFIIGEFMGSPNLTSSNKTIIEIKEAVGGEDIVTDNVYVVERVMWGKDVVSSYGSQVGASTAGYIVDLFDVNERTYKEFRVAEGTPEYAMCDDWMRATGRYMTGFQNTGSTGKQVAYNRDATKFLD